MTSTSAPLSPAERRALRARAHPLQPVVIVGSKGLTESVLKEAEVALETHELIKVKLASDDREERASQFLTLTAALSASPVQQIGKIAVLYREKAEKPRAPTGARPQPRTARPAGPSRVRAASRPPTAAVGRDRGHSGDSPARRARSPTSRPGPARKPRSRP